MRLFAGPKDLNCYGNFICDDGSCVGLAKVCNGVFDCNDGSDEMKCGKTNLRPYFFIVEVFLLIRFFQTILRVNRTNTDVQAVTVFHKNGSVMGKLTALIIEKNTIAVNFIYLTFSLKKV